MRVKISKRLYVRARSGEMKIYCVMTRIWFSKGFANRGGKEGTREGQIYRNASKGLSGKIHGSPLEEKLGEKNQKSAGGRT